MSAHRFAGHGGHTGYTLYFALAIAVTAVLVLARILTDSGLEHSGPGRLAFAVAAIGDGVAWGGLTVILASHPPGVPASA